MRSTIFSVLVLGVSALVGAHISSPASGDQWAKDQNQQITWDNSGMASTCDIHLVPAGATDTKIIISEIAISVSNTGSYQWIPDSSITVSEVEIIIVDSRQTIVISSVFTIIDVLLQTTKDSYTRETSTKTYDEHTSKETSTKTYDDHTSKETHTETYEHTSEEISTKTVTSFVTRYTSLRYIHTTDEYGHDTTSLTTVEITTTVSETLEPASTTAVVLTSAAATSIAAPSIIETTSAAAPSIVVATSVAALTTFVPSSAPTPVAANNASLTLARNATPTAAPFSGDGSSFQSTLNSVLVASVVGLVTILLL